jgi:hypothetical protein
MIHKGREYIEKRGTSDYAPDAGELHKMNSGLRSIVSKDQHGLRWLPYVSVCGLASFRTLNSQFGMKAPLMGLPLKRAAFDGKINVTPSSYLDHEINHGSAFGGLVFEALGDAYDDYRKADAIVRGINDAQVQSLCDFFLFEVGHEKAFGIWELGKFIPTSGGEERFSTVVMRPKNFEEICNESLQKLEEDTREICQSLPLDYQWETIKSARLGENEPLLSETHDVYYGNTSMLKHFVNPTKSGLLFSLVEMINQGKINKSKTLEKKELVDPIIPNIGSTLNPRAYADHELMMWCDSGMNVLFYNQLIGLQVFFNQKGIKFDLWEGDEFQADAIAAVFKMACETFKREMEPHFKSFDR